MFGLFETGFQIFYWGNLLMLLIGGVLIYLGISKKMEPLLLVPIGFGILLINLPLGGLMDYELQIANTGEAPGKVISIDVDKTRMNRRCVDASIASRDVVDIGRVNDVELWQCMNAVDVIEVIEGD